MSSISSVEEIVPAFVWRDLPETEKPLRRSRCFQGGTGDQSQQASGAGCSESARQDRAGDLKSLQRLTTPPTLHHLKNKRFAYNQSIHILFHALDLSIFQHTVMPMDFC
jgi:hypothetical protein